MTPDYCRVKLKTKTTTKEGSWREVKPLELLSPFPSAPFCPSPPDAEQACLCLSACPPLPGFPRSFVKAFPALELAWLGAPSSLHFLCQSCSSPHQLLPSSLTFSKEFRMHVTAPICSGSPVMESYPDSQKELPDWREKKVLSMH